MKTISAQLPLIHTRVVLLFFLFWGLMCSAAWAQLAVPALDGPVVDEAMLLRADTREEVSRLIYSHEDSTSNQIAVLTVPTLNGEALEPYALRVAQTWQLGQSDRSNGVLLLVAVAERKVRIEVGYGLEGDLPDITAGRIIDWVITPHFKAGNFDKGILEGVTAIAGAIEGSYTPTEASHSSDNLLLGFAFILVPLAVLCYQLLQPALTFWILASFFLVIMSAGGADLFPNGGIIVPAVVFVVLLGIRIYLKRSPKWRKIMKAIAKARPGQSVPISVGGRTFNYTPSSSSGGSSSRSYSGGGGSFGGGGASGSW